MKRLLGNKKSIQNLVLASISAVVILCGIFNIASAHEAYVLDHGRIQLDRNEASPNPFSEIHDNLKGFALWGGLQLLFLLVFLYLNYRGFLAKTLAPAIQGIKQCAPTVARIFLGLSFIYGSFQHAIFGPEIPLTELGLPHVLQFVLFVVGVMLLVGIAGRVAAAIALILYVYTFYFTGTYLLSYINYLAEILLVLIAGSGIFSLDHLIAKLMDKQKPKLHHWGVAFEKKYGGLVLRLGLGLALAYAAINVKFLHSQLSLDVINQYHLVNYFHFDPLFIVLGAGLIELCIAGMYLFGVLVRINTVMFLTFITLSLLFFGEAVWPHYILFGISLAIFMYGYDTYTLEKQVIHRISKEKGEAVF